MKRVVIVQSNYIPWKGYFDLIAAADECILLDEVQFTKRDWRNRNRIKTPQGIQWLTVPVLTRGAYHQAISATRIVDGQWSKVHWESLARSYRRAPHFDSVAQVVKPIYLEQRHTHLSELNRVLIGAVCGVLGIPTRVNASSDYELTGTKSERLVSLCRQSGATEYITGPAARAYLDETLFGRTGIRVRWFDYSGYPEYPQLWGGFTHEVSALDLLFNCGGEAPRYMQWGRA